jgi:heat shock protein HslJ
MTTACGDDGPPQATGPSVAASTSAAATTAAVVTTAVETSVAAATSAAATDPTTTETPGSETSVGGAAVSLEGPTWTLTEGVPLNVPMDGVTVTARFEAGTLTGTSGCNDYTTRYQLQGSSLSIAPEIAVTRKACPDPQTAVEDEYLDRLPNVASYAVSGDTLTLSDADGGLLLEYAATDMAESLLGDWTVTSYYSGDAVTSVIGDVALTTTFDDQDVSGHAGCNSFNGPYTVDGDAIEIGPLASTMAACPNEELQQQETDYLAALELATSFAVTGDRLDLFRPGGTFAATLERA